MRVGVTDFGTADRPLSRCQRSITWAAVVPYLSAISFMTGSRSEFREASPSGVE